MITVPDTVILPIRDPPKRPSIGLKRDIRSIQMSTRKMGRFASPLEDDGMMASVLCSHLKKRDFPSDRKQWTFYFQRFRMFRYLILISLIDSHSNNINENFKSQNSSNLSVEGVQLKMTY